MAEKGVDAIGGGDVLEGCSFERLPVFDPRAPYDFRERAARIDAITRIGKAIAEHLVARHGTDKRPGSVELMDEVWNALNRREWLGLIREEGGILMLQLDMLLGFSLMEAFW